MSDSATNTTNMPQTTPTYSVESKPVTTPIQSTPTTVDMTAAKGTSVESQVEQKPHSTGLDITTKDIPSNYFQKYMSGINKADNFTATKYNVDIKFGDSLRNPKDTKHAFFLSIKRQDNGKTFHKQVDNITATLDKNFKYTGAELKGEKVLMRMSVATIALPEQIDSNGNVVDNMPKNFPDLHDFYSSSLCSKNTLA